MPRLCAAALGTALPARLPPLPSRVMLAFLSLAQVLQRRVAELEASSESLSAERDALRSRVQTLAAFQTSAATAATALQRHNAELQAENAALAESAQRLAVESSQATYQLAEVLRHSAPAGEVEKLLTSALEVQVRDLCPRRLSPRHISPRRLSARHLPAPPDPPALLAASLGSQERLLGGEHEETVATSTLLAATLERQGRFPEAEARYQAVLATRQNSLGAQHELTLQAMSNLASLLTQTAQYEDAAPLHRQALEVRRKALGDEHERTLVCTSNLAILLKQTGRYEVAPSNLPRPFTDLPWPSTRYEGAARLLRQVLDVQRRDRGEEHEDTVATMNNLAILCEEMQCGEEAEALYRRVLHVRRRDLGEAHEDCIQSMTNLASLLGHGERAEEAEVLYRQAEAADRIGSEWRLRLRSLHTSVFTPLSSHLYIHTSVFTPLSYTSVFTPLTASSPASRARGAFPSRAQAGSRGEAAHVRRGRRAHAHCDQPTGGKERAPNPSLPI